MKYLQTLLIITAITLFSACEKEIILDQSEYPPKLVLNCLLDPTSDTITLSLTESRDLLYENDEFPPVLGATITFFDNGTNIGTFNEKSNGIYELAYTVVPNHTYKVSVTNTNFDDVSSSTTVPNPGTLINFNVDLVLINELLRANIDFTFQDVANNDNYYGFSIERIDTNKLDSIQTYPGYEYYPPYVMTYFCSPDVNIEYPTEAYQGEICGDLILMSDKSFDGQQYNFRCNNESYVYSSNGDPINTSDFYTKIKYFFKTYNEDYFKYVLSTKIAQENYGNPFAEPVRIYNNIEGGFGIFGAFNVVVDSVEFN